MLGYPLGIELFVPGTLRTPTHYLAWIVYEVYMTDSRPRRRYNLRIVRYKHK